MIRHFQGFKGMCLTITLSVAMLVSCAVMKRIMVDMAACSAGHVPGEVMGHLDEVESILAGGDDWAMKLEVLGKRLGMDVVNCLVAAVKANALHRLASTIEPALREAIILPRAAAWLGLHASRYR